MKQKLILILSFLFAANLAYACASFVPDAKNPKSGGTVKHFFKGDNEARALLIKNDTNANCRMVLKPLEILQRADGRYRYIEYSPTRVIEGSLAPYLDIISQNGQSLVQTEVTLKPNETINAKMLMALDLPNDSRVGTWIVAIKAFFPEYPAQLTMTEIYYSSQWAVPTLSLNDLAYNKENQSVSYTLKGTGLHYTPVQFQLVMIEPKSGIEVSSFIDGDGETHSFVGHIRNYFIPNAHAEKIIQAEINIASYNQLFLNRLKQEGVDPNTVNEWILYVRPYHGFDWKSWQKHYYVPLAAKTIQIKK